MTRDEANRANALLSTGPRTPEGKATSAQNARTHGLLSRAALLPDDDAATFAAFSEALWIELAPVGAVQEMLTDRIIGQAWRLRRAAILDAALVAYESESAASFARGKSPAAVLGLAATRMVRSGAPTTLSRYETAIERSMLAAMGELRRLRESDDEPPGKRPPVVIDGEAEAAPE